jgi:hypothetical protein
MSVTNKICRLCRKRTPIENFQTPHHRICTVCVDRRRRETLRWLGRELDAPGVPKGPALTGTREGLRKYDRERKRQMAPDRKPPRFPLAMRWCRSCNAQKPAGEFGSWRHRVCMKCDGPALRQS